MFSGFFGGSGPHMKRVSEIYFVNLRNHLYIMRLTRKNNTVKTIRYKKFLKVSDFNRIVINTIEKEKIYRYRRYDYRGINNDLNH